MTFVFLSGQLGNGGQIQRVLWVNGHLVRLLDANLTESFLLFWLLSSCDPLILLTTESICFWPMHVYIFLHEPAPHSILLHVYCLPRTHPYKYNFSFQPKEGILLFFLDVESDYFFKKKIIILKNLFSLCNNLKST